MEVAVPAVMMVAALGEASVALGVAISADNKIKKLTKDMSDLQNSQVVLETDEKQEIQQENNTFGIFGQTQQSSLLQTSLTQNGSVVSETGIPLVSTHGYANNLFIESRTWISPFIVDKNTNYGDRGTFSSIQAAIDACFAKGGGTIFIRLGTYTENLTLHAQCMLVGVQTDARAIQINMNTGVIINGHHTLSDTGAVVCTNLAFHNMEDGDIFTVQNSTSIGVIALRNCFVNHTGSGRVALCNPTGDFAVFSADTCTFATIDDIIRCQGNSIFNISQCSLSSSGGNGLYTELGGNVTRSDLSCPQIAFQTGGFNSLNLFNCFVTNCSTGVHFTDSNGTVLAFCNVWNASAGSGEYVDGPGTYTVTNETLIGSAKNVANTVTYNVPTWGPFSTIGTQNTARRGTCGFNSVDFVVTSDGFVSKNSIYISGYTDLSGTVTINNPILFDTISSQSNITYSNGLFTLTQSAPYKISFSICNNTAQEVKCALFVNNTIVPGTTLNSSTGSAPFVLFPNSVEIILSLASSDVVEVRAVDFDLALLPASNHSATITMNTL